MALLRSASGLRQQELYITSQLATSIINTCFFFFLELIVWVRVQMWWDFVFQIKQQTICSLVFQLKVFPCMQTVSILVCRLQVAVDPINFFSSNIPAADSGDLLVSDNDTEFAINVLIQASCLTLKNNVADEFVFWRQISIGYRNVLSRW